MDWIHCNDCFKQPCSTANLSLFLTACARIQCSDCSISNSCVTKDCKPCRSQNFKAVPLDDSIPPAVEDYFHDPLDHLKRFLKVYEFQRNHRNRLLKNQQEKEKQFYCQAAQLKKTTSELQSQIIKHKAETRNVQEENVALKKRIQELENSLALDRRPLAKDNHNNDLSNSFEHKKRNQPTSDDCVSVASWQQKMPYAPNANRAGGLPRHPRFNVPVQQPLQPSKPRTQQSFFNPDTPAYFPSNAGTPTTTVIQSSNVITKYRTSVFPMPNVNRVRQSTIVTPSITRTLPVKEAQDQQQQKRQGITHNRVYAYMSEAARQALTPEV